ncbi:two-component sensor histidine kinase [Anabaena cylindrica FACHB-243]|uniref:histidine kinase n=1 Tax=Anabaena cylindrica (strain ATCC 27899 / PCC 7122) TaxID=272123 RepID=K9ZHC7_ANACC|nr:MULTISPECIES: ATP-binding protein [Anabaena]AFZ57972.1 integral membrane sensor signal transduction histidine kinase [Anabaena cylindrica PCC 7122]MBD2420782.1 two-component sensor histidine kinase [Anabaena cylindrica FACHB-243]MBY5282703.1 two-component sensor histidine kinase [Anabaena sp. CCAP 1446/1C]MBY5307123.1 two-component sensor histidine kinase [Anabaena sp. CCAP 1446/1C]MCM2408198.1 ATP-binding protein [Anabaena sp. CCAP 1446/1C]
MFQATRRRLALWYTAVTAILLLLFATGVYLYVRSTLVERVDDTLNHVVEVVERSLVIEPVNFQTNQIRVNIEASFRNNADNAEDDHIDLEWFSPTGKLLWSTFSEPLDIPIHNNPTGETVRVVGMGRWGDSDPHSELSKDSALLLRQVTQRVEMGRQVLGYLRVSHPWFEVTKPSRQLIFDLALGTGLMVISVAASGWFLSGKAMEPVRESYQRLKQFTADASHELRSPIALIQTNVQVALADLELGEVKANNVVQYRQQLKIVERLTQRLGKLVNDLLFLARQDSGISTEVFSSCPLDALLIEVVEEQQLLATEREITLILNLIDPPSELNPELLENWFTLMGNWDQIVRLCTNLISNALQYTPIKGEVKIELARLEGINRVSGMRYTSSQLQLKVSDTGVGIPPEAIPRLFDRFYRVDPARTHQTPKIANTTGSGLGLAIAQAIVEHHQGQIQIDSIVGEGTTFTVILPITVGV